MDFAIIAHAGGGKPFVDALGALDTRNYFDANMALLHHAQLRDDAVVAQWQRLTSKIEHDGGVYRFLETHEKWKNAKPPSGELDGAFYRRADGYPAAPPDSVFRRLFDGN